MDKHERTNLLVFLSYSHLDRNLAGDLKKGLERFGIKVFLAHEDIEPSEEWEKSIVSQLEKCDVLVPVLTTSFSASKWTDQEVGIAFAHGKVIIPLKVDTIPYGFMKRYQALSLIDGPVSATSNKLAKIIASKKVIGDRFREDLINQFGSSDSYRQAYGNAQLLEMFEPYNTEQLERIMKYTIGNSQIYAPREVIRVLKRLVSKNVQSCSVDADLVKAFNQAISRS